MARHVAQHFYVPDPKMRKGIQRAFLQSHIIWNVGIESFGIRARWRIYNPLKLTIKKNLSNFRILTLIYLERIEVHIEIITF